MRHGWSAFFATFLIAAAAHGSDPGVSSTEIKVGSLSSFTGLPAALGRAAVAGANALYDQVNKAGGVNGRLIKYLPMDDGAEPDRSVANFKKMVEVEKIFALVGGNGTTQYKAVSGLAKDAGVPILFPLTGGEFLVNPPTKGFFNIRVNYQEEAQNLVDYAVKTLGTKEIGIVFQNDAYGISGESGVARALAASGLKIHGKVSFQRGSEDMAAAVKEMSAAHPQAVFLQGNNKSVSVFVKTAALAGFNPIYLASSLPALDIDKLLSGVKYTMYTSNVLPSPTDGSIPLIKSYLQDAKEKHVEIGYSSLEGYVGAALFVEVLKKIDGEPTREKLNAALENLKDFDLRGLKISFARDRHQGLSSVAIWQIKDGKMSLLRAL